VAAHLTPDLLAFLRAWLPPPPARVLDVGCGSGDSTRQLLASGFDVLGLDPEAPAGEGFARAALEELEPQKPFDAAVAIRSLHHVHDLETAIDRLSGALRPEGRLVAFEFAVERVDADARRWLADHGHEHALGRLGDVLTLGELEAALARRFRPLLAEPATYLARDLEREDLLSDEERAIARGELRPIGARLVYERL
jgi:SAM-dependent methyltransferase